MEREEREGSRRWLSRGRWKREAGVLPQGQGVTSACSGMGCCPLKEKFQSLARAPQGIKAGRGQELSQK